MKKLIFLMLFGVGAYAQSVHRVTNGMNLQTVIDNAASGDVILVEAGNYGNIEVSKTLTLIGTGYLLNNELSAYPGSANLSNVKFHPNAENATIQGFEIVSLDIDSPSVQVKKNRIGSIVVGNTLKSDYVNISSNFIYSARQLNCGSYTACIAVEFKKNSSNFIIANNIILNGFRIDSQGLGLIINNHFLSSHVAYQCNNCALVEFRNNIFNTFGSSPNGWGLNIFWHFKPNIVNKNVFVLSSSQLPKLDNTNVFGVDFTLLFVNSGSNLQEDARYQLAPNSPARGAGENGTDCGAFGGDDPYVLSGIPDIPSIYQLNVQSSVPQGGTLQVQIKAKTNN